MACLAADTTALAAVGAVSQARVVEETAAVKLTKAGRKVLAAGRATRSMKSAVLLSSEEATGTCRSLVNGPDSRPVSFAVESLPVICGYMYKKSPQKLRLTSWDQRFFVLVNMKMFWWKDRQSCALDITGRERAATAEIESQSQDAKYLPRYKGMINFTMSEPRIVSLWSEKTQFRMLAPASGWREGATTDKRNDAGRDYEFDTGGSSRSRSEWVDLIRQHIEQARCLGGGSEESSCSGGETGSEYWEDVTVDEKSHAMSKYFAKKAQANKETREQKMPQ
mmetsp:Transcript_82525/g.215028  ORF Transcript_82525/g.215028 Transcript_82525/m.215028 type:complete len:280 (+) Transcript_82525:89-928(+)